MILKDWEQLPEELKTEEVRYYYDILNKKKRSLYLKRIFDVSAAAVLLLFLSPVFVILAIMIALDSPGGVFFRQVRVTAYGQKFKIYKFRTMQANAEKIGSQVTVGNDARITRAGAFLRKTRLDELPQLINVLNGTMSFVGTRPEVPKYVNHYTNEMKATLLLPAGITSEASIRYKKEAELLEGATDVDSTYINVILPDKMKYNLMAIEKFSFFGEILTMFRTVFAVLGKDYDENKR